jgi:ubiquinone/menaquinone biosynthesis C-methylase UbiE
LPDVRKEREISFHDKTFAEHSRSQAWKFYAITQSSHRYFERLLLDRCAGKEVLEYGCGPASYALYLASHGAKVTGIDISPVAIEIIKKRASDEGLSDATSFCTMDAEALQFPDHSFDAICGSAILHHLDLHASMRQICRVLKPGGEAFFVEPLGQNALINLYRRITPQYRTADEHPLLMEDIRLISEFFEKAELRYFHMTSLALVGLQRFRAFPGMVKAADQLDQFLFRIPFMRTQAWQVILSLSRPRK